MTAAIIRGVPTKLPKLNFILEGKHLKHLLFCFVKDSLIGRYKVQDCFIFVKIHLLRGKLGVLASTLFGAHVIGFWLAVPMTCWLVGDSFKSRCLLTVISYFSRRLLYAHEPFPAYSPLTCATRVYRGVLASFRNSLIELWNPALLWMYKYDFRLTSYGTTSSSLIWSKRCWIE